MTQFLRTVLFLLWTWVLAAENPVKLAHQPAWQDLSELAWCFIPLIWRHPRTSTPSRLPPDLLLQVLPKPGKKRKNSLGNKYFIFFNRDKENRVSKIAPKDLISDPWLSHPSSRPTKWGVRPGKRNSFHFWQYPPFWLAEALLSRVGEFADIHKPWQRW